MYTVIIIIFFKYTFHFLYLPNVYQFNSLVNVAPYTSIHIKTPSRATIRI